MKRILFAALLGSCIAPVSVDAQTTSGNALYDTCTSDNTVLAGFCIGYIMGLVEGQFWGGLLSAKAAGIQFESQDFNATLNEFFQHCIPQDATNEQLRDVVVKYLRNNPATRHQTARILVWQAYREAFPC